MLMLIKKLLEFFSEDNGNLSNTRLNATVMIVLACVILAGATFGWAGAKLETNTLAAAGLLITAGTGSKLIQKTMEEKTGAQSS